MAEQLNTNFKRFITLVKQAKLSGSNEIRLPIKQADDLIMELTLLFSDKIVSGDNKSDNTNNIDLSNISLSGGGFKK